MNRFFWLLLLSLVLLTGFGPVPAPGDAVIALQTGPLPFVPTGFYIEQVQDGRAQRGAFASLLLRPGKPVTAVDLAGGTAPAIYSYIARSLKQNRSLRPIVLRITVGNLTETPVGINGNGPG